VKKAIFIYNPASGDRTVPDRLDQIIERFMKKDILLHPFRIQNGDDKKLLEALHGSDYSFAVLSGGDGTINLTLNTALKNGINMPIGVIPSGTCNDFSRGLDLPFDLNKSIDTILKGKTTEIDVGVINDEKYFLGTCAGGMLVDISYNTSSELKRSMGNFAYYMKAFSEVGNIRPFNLKVKTDNEIVEGKFLLFMIVNGRQVAGFPNIAKQADISDGLMDIILVKNCMYIDLAVSFFKMLANDISNDRNIITLKSRSCEVEGSKNVAITIDGEKGDRLPLKVDFIKRALKVFVP
jgi:YegS/Rv2252/BmrU family lipid kinase